MKSPLIHLGIVSIIGLSTIVGYGVWHNVVATKSAEVADLQNQIIHTASSVNRITAIQASLADLASHEDDIQNYFLPEADVASFNDRLEALGKSQGAAVQVLSVAKGGTKERPILTFSLAINGTFDAVMRTIGVLEYAPYALTIGAFQLQTNDKKLWHADLSLTVGSLATAVATSTKP